MVEGMEDLDAFEELYKGLGKRYDQLGFKDYDFDYDYFDTYLGDPWIPNLIKNLRKELTPQDCPILNPLMDMAMDNLYQMETRLNKLYEAKRHYQSLLDKRSN